MNYNVKNICAKRGCDLCSADGQTCLKCGANWQYNQKENQCGRYSPAFPIIFKPYLSVLSLRSKVKVCNIYIYISIAPIHRFWTTECAEGAGTYADTFYSHPPSTSSLRTGPLMTDNTCMYRIFNPAFHSVSRLPGHCNPANPRVIQQSYIDHPDCTCKSCGTRWTSNGGPPRVAFCYPQVIPQYFKLEVILSTPMKRRGPYDYTSFTSAIKVMSALAQAAIVSSLGTGLEIKRYGAIQRGDLKLPPTDSSHFASIYVFNGTRENLLAVLKATNECSKQLPYNCGIDFLSLTKIGSKANLLDLVASNMEFSSSDGRLPTTVSTSRHIKKGLITHGFDMNLLHT